MKPFLRAEWRKLILLTYAVDEKLLAPYLPRGLELDKKEGLAFVSFVAFEFLNTRVRGVPIPFHINFPEINLRFYVRHKERRGVCFIKELVPRHCIALVAKRVYNEPYEYASMYSQSTLKGKQWSVNHSFEYGGQKHEIGISAENKPFFPSQNSTEYFFKEHEWGFGTTHKGNLMQYRVTHPEWSIYPITSQILLNLDFGAIYGPAWAVLNGQTPYNVLLAEGSPIEVYPGSLVK